MGYWTIKGKRYSNEEYEALKQQEKRAREQASQRAEDLLRRLAASYTELTDFMRENPGIVQRVESNEEQTQQAIYQKLSENLERANAAPRCCWIKSDGTGCGSPKLRTGQHCFAHEQMWKADAKKLRISAVEDGNGVQMAIMEVQKALIDDEISEKKAGLLFYSLQIAAANLDRTTFGEKPEEMVTDGICDDYQDTETRGEEQELPLIDTEDRDQGPFTTEGTEDHREGLRQDNADGVEMVMAAGKMLPESVGVAPMNESGAVG